MSTGNVNVRLSPPATEDRSSRTVLPDKSASVSWSSRFSPVALPTVKATAGLSSARNTLTVEGAEIAHSVEEALTLAARYPRTFVIGGASVFREFLPYVDLVHVTKIDSRPKSDSFFEDLDASPDWRVREAGDWQEEDGLRFRFMSYERV